MRKNNGCMLVANQASTSLGKLVATELKIDFSSMIRKEFSDGEIYHAFPEDVSGKDLIIIGATHNESSHQEVMDLIHGGRFWNAASINVIIPYLGYSTMERAKQGSFEIPKGITRTRQIFRAGPDFVAFVDLHSEAVMHTHAGDINVKHIWTDELVVDKIINTNLSDYVLVSPDYGFSKRVATLARKLGCSHTAADKDRYDVDKTIVGQVSAVVKGKTAIICDDMIRTGGSIVQTAERCREAGAKQIVVMATHLVMSGDAREKFKKAGIAKVIGADTYPGVATDDLLDVYSVAKILAYEIDSYL